MQLNIEIEVQGCESSDINITNQCETLTLEIIDAPVSPSGSIDDSAGLGDTYVTWSADKSSRELADKVDKVTGYSLVANDEITKLSTVEQDAQKNTVSSVAGKHGDVLLDKSDVGLGAVDNTSDLNKQISNPTQAALDDKVDKVAGKGLSDTNFTQAEKDKLTGVAAEATKNRSDSENADKVHTHTTAQVVGLDTALGSKASKTELTTGLGLKVDKEAGKGLSTEDYTNPEKVKLSGIQSGAQVNAVISVSGKTGVVTLTKANVGLSNVDNTSDINKPLSTATTSALNNKVDKEAGKGLSDENYTQAEKTKLAGVANNATANRVDSENADKVHTHAISDITGLSVRLDSIDTLIGDIESVLVAINGEP